MEVGMEVGNECGVEVQTCGCDGLWLALLYVFYHANLTLLCVTHCIFSLPPFPLFVTQKGY